MALVRRPLETLEPINMNRLIVGSKVVAMLSAPSTLTPVY